MLTQNKIFVTINVSKQEKCVKKGTKEDGKVQKGKW